MKRTSVLLIVAMMVGVGLFVRRDYSKRNKPYIVEFNEELTTSNLHAPELKVKNSDENKIVLSWDKDSRELTVGEGVAWEYALRSGYRIYRDGQWYTDVVDEKYTFMDEGLYPGETYKYQISALTFDNKIEGNLSETVSISIPGTAQVNKKRVVSAKKILVEGDSVAAGIGVGSVASWPSLLASELRVEVINKSMVGSFSSQVLERIQDDIAQSNPDLVIVAIGTNDLWAASTTLGNVSLNQYIGNLERIIYSARSKNIDVVLTNLHPITCCSDKTRVWNKAIRDLGYGQNVPVVDVFTEIEEHGGVKLLIDKLHPNPRAHEIISIEVSTLLSEER